jgi:hypothetical protein
MIVLPIWAASKYQKLHWGDEKMKKKMNAWMMAVFLISSVMATPALAAVGSVRTVLCKVKSYDATIVTMACGKRWIKAPRAQLKVNRLKEGNVVGVPLDPKQWKQFQATKVYTLK